MPKDTLLVNGQVCNVYESHEVRVAITDEAIAIMNASGSVIELTASGIVLNGNIIVPLSRLPCPG